jgi:hypothetical protein
MPVWGWVCIGLVGLAVVAVGLFWVFVVLPYERQQKRLEQHGQTVVGYIFLANPSLYDTKPPAAFEGGRSSCSPGPTTHPTSISPSCGR